MREQQEARPVDLKLEVSIVTTQKRIKGVGTSGRPAAANLGDSIYLAWKGVADDPGVYWATFDGNNWSAQATIGGHFGTAVGPAVAVLNDQVHMAFRGVAQIGDQLVDDQRIYEGQLHGDNYWGLFVPDVGSSI